MLLRLFVFFIFIQHSFSQEEVTVLVDSLSIVSSETEKSRISLEIAEKLANTDWKRALHYIEVGEDAALKTGSEKVLADYYTQTGYIYYDKDALDVALDYLLKAYDYYRDREFAEKYGLENRLAIVYARIENHDLALQYFQRIYSYQFKQKDTIFLAKTLNNIGNLYLETEIDSSLLYYHRSLSFVKELEDDNLFLYLYTNLGRAYAIKGQHEIAKTYFIKAVALRDENVDVRTIAWTYNEFSELYLNKDMSDSSIYFAQRANRILDSVAPYSFGSQRSVELLYKAYVANNDYKSAATYFDTFNNIRDSINIEEKKVNVEKLMIAQEYRSKEKIRVLEESERRFKYLIIGLSLLTLLLVLIILLLRYRTKLKNSQLEKELIQARRKELVASLELKNKELIGKAMNEIHRTEIIDDILIDLKSVKRKAVRKETQQAIDFIAKRLERDTSNNMWQEFEVRFEQVHESFYRNLFEKHPDLTPRDKRLCALLKLNLASKEIAQITGQSFKSVENARTRLRKKLDITNIKTDLSSYLAGLG